MANTSTRGFSLVELLVVIAIIGLLASIVFASLSTVQSKARDARRLADIDSIRKALILYAGTVGTYPIATATTTLTGGDAVSTALVGAGVITAIPKDPTDPVYQYSYTSNNIGNRFWIGFCLETNQYQNFNQGCGNYMTP